MARFVRDELNGKKIVGEIKTADLIKRNHKKWREKNPTGKKLIVIEIQKLTLKQFGNGGKNGQDNYQ